MKRSPQDGVKMGEQRGGHLLFGVFSGQTDKSFHQQKTRPQGRGRAAAVGKLICPFGVKRGKKGLPLDMEILGNPVFGKMENALKVLCGAGFGDLRFSQK